MGHVAQNSQAMMVTSWPDILTIGITSFLWKMRSELQTAKP